MFRLKFNFFLQMFKLLFYGIQKILKAPCLLREEKVKVRYTRICGLGLFD